MLTVSKFPEETWAQRKSNQIKKYAQKLRLRSHVKILKYREWGVTISRKLPNKNIAKIDYRQAWRTALSLVRQDVISAEKVFPF